MGAIYAVLLNVLMIFWIAGMVSLYIGINDPVTFKRAVNEMDPYVNEVKKHLNIKKSSKDCPVVFAEGLGEALISAVEDDRLDLVECIMSKKGFDINYRDMKFGKTALMKAIDYTHHEIALFLIAKGADVNMKDKRGKSVVEFASDSGNQEVLSAIRGHEEWNGVEPLADAGNNEKVKSEAQKLGEKAVEATAGSTIGNEL